MRVFDSLEAVDAAQGLAYANGWVLPDYDWSTWGDTPECRALRDDSEILAQAADGRQPRGPIL